MKAWIKRARFTLEKSPGILKVGDKQISFTKKFKESAVLAYQNGKTPGEIFLSVGLDPKIFLDDYCCKSILRWKAAIEKHGVTALNDERRGKKASGRPRGNGKPKRPKTQTQFEERLAYLEAENEFLKKLRALAKQGK